MFHIFNKNVVSITFFLRQALLRVALSAVFFMICRGVFYLFNRAILPVPTVEDFVWGIRFDVSAALYVNVLLWLTYLLPFNFRFNKGYLFFQKWLFISTNFIAYSFELMDVAFFRFQNRRTLLTDFGLVKNTLNLLPKYLTEYWFLIVFSGVFLWFLKFLYEKTTLNLNANAQLIELNSTNIFDRFQPHFIQFLMGIFGIVFWLIAARGGTQLRPITPLSTADFVSDMRLMPLMSNTTLNFIHSTGQTFLTPKTYMTDAEAKAIYPIFGQFEPKDSLRKFNVVVIALESFGKDYSQYFNAEEKNYQGFTPFLDSLAKASLQAQQSFANGLRSAQGISAITAGLPSLMEEQFVFSPYQSNQLDGLAAHLRRNGYETAFFHGSNPGSMEFDKFARLTGFNHFYDRYGYGNQADFDGNWGIWDAPMFQFMAQKFSQMPEPFYGFFFSLTSHHPYNVPLDFEKRYPNVDALHRSVLYTDDALRQFFDTAKKQSWFDKTLFVIAADHIGAGCLEPKYQTKVGRYAIPILFYKPNEIKPEVLQNSVVQQQDIMPSVLDFLNYKKPFLSFGRSIFNKNKPINSLELMGNKNQLNSINNSALNTNKNQLNSVNNNELNSNKSELNSINKSELILNKNELNAINLKELNPNKTSTNPNNAPLQTSNFKLQTNYSFHFEEGLFQIHDSRFALFFDGDRTTGLYDYTTDVFLKNNLKDSLPNEVARLENVLKAVIQQYHKAMISNQLVPK
jgi:phosphoglycerol transferase MdoB-like AlkP superfamily enzyme